MASLNWGFCDLFLSKNYELNNLHLIEKLGFNTVAINTYVEESNDEPKKKKKGEGKDFIPSPLIIPKDILDTCKLNVLQRVTIEFSDSSIAHKMNRSENIKKFDIIAVIPKTIQAFQYACGAMDIDIITFEPEGRIPFKVSRKLYRQAVERGIFFEIMYSPAIRDTTSRRNIISTAHIYHAVGKSRNIIVSSGADNYTHIRDIHDVINLGILFGLHSNQSLEVIRNNARRVILKATGRRNGKHYMFVEQLEENKISKDCFAFAFNQHKRPAPALYR